MPDGQIEHVSLADAKNRIEELVARAAGGEIIVIERGDGSAARLQPEAAPKQPVPYDWDEHWAWLKQQPMDTRPQEEIDAELRAMDRY